MKNIYRSHSAGVSVDGSLELLLQIRSMIVLLKESTLTPKIWHMHFKMHCSFLNVYFNSWKGQVTSSSSLTY